MSMRVLPTRRAVSLGLGAAITLFAGPSLAQFLAGTAYDRLDLSSPDAALRAFLTAYRQGDYVTVYWILAPATQLEWQKRLMMLDLGPMLRKPRGQASFPTATLEELVPPIDQWEQQDTSFLFAHVMTFAKSHDLLPLDLAGLPDDLSPAGLPELGTLIRTDERHAELTVPLKAYAQPVVFRLETSPLGKWRVRQVIPPGGDEASLPWGLRRR